MFELIATRAGQRVELRFAAGVRLVPLRREPPFVLEPMERGIKRPLRNLQQGARRRGDALRDRVTVKRFERESFQDEQVERALQQIGLGCRRRRPAMLPIHR